MKIYQHYSIYGFSNTYIVGNDDSGQAIIIDPAEVTTSIIEQLEHNKYSLEAVLVTHDHLHHVRGLKTLMRIYSPAIYASNARIFKYLCHKVRDRDIMPVAGFEVEALAVPGHSQDSIVFRIGDYLFTGDAWHAGLIGKTTSSFNAQALSERLTRKLLILSDETMLFPGHGPPTTLGTERTFNLGLQPGYAERLHPSYDFFV